MLGPLLLALAVGATDDDAGTPAPMAVESFEPIESFEPADAGVAPAIESFTAAPAFSPTVKFFGFVKGDGSLDTRFDSPRNVPMAENVLEGRLRTQIGVDVKVSERVRLVLEGRAQVRAVSQRDFDRGKAFFEPMLGEAYVDLYTPKVDVRLGQQRIALGANAAFAPADVLNPRDLRESFLMADPEDSILPVFALRAQGELGSIAWLAAYAPFFQPHRYNVFGQDDSIVQPALGQTIDNRQIDPSIEDGLQEHVLETKKPTPFAGDVALRARSTGRFKIGASWVWMNEKLPQVRIDPELSRLLAAQGKGEAISPALAASVASRLQAGEALFRGTYARTHVFSLEGSTLLGPIQVDADVAISPRQTFFDITGKPLDKTALTWVVGGSQAEQSEWIYALSYMGMAVFKVAANEQLAIIEPATAAGAARVAWFHLISGVLGRTFLDGKLELSLRAAFEPIQRSFAIAPRVAYRPVERLTLSVAGEVFEGSAWSAFGYFTRNDRVIVGVRYDLF